VSHDTLAVLLPWLLTPTVLAAVVVLGNVARDSLTHRTTARVVVPPGWTRTVTRTRRGGVVVRLHRQPTLDRSSEQQPVVSVSR